MTSRAVLAVAALLLPLGPAWAQHPAGHGAAMGGMPMPGAGPAPAAGPTAEQDMMAGMERMNRDMAAAPMTGDADKDFVAMMIPHHQGAIDMARVQLRHGRDPKLRRLAQAVIAAQEKEITEMRAWQKAHP